MSKFDNWYQNNPTSCDAKISHMEGRIFILRWVLDKVGKRSPDGRKGCWDSVDEFVDDVKRELTTMLGEHPAVLNDRSKLKLQENK